MESITINVTDEELEAISVELTSEEVRSLYNLRKEQAKKIEEQAKKIEELTKQLDQEKKNLEYNRLNYNEAQTELNEGHNLLSALGVQEKTKDVESYYRKDLKIATRIALYIAANK